MGLLREISEQYKTVALVGMAKNAGKTTALNYLIAQAEDEGLRLGVTSTGRDGETVDVVTGTEKPRVYLPEDALVAVPAGIYDLSAAGLEILRMTDFSSPLGTIMICRVAEAGYVQVAGPVTTAGQKSLCAMMLAMGAELVLIDGAIDRKSIATPDASDAIILSTGAVLSRNMVKAADETGFVVEVFSLPTLDDEAARAAIAERPDKILVIRTAGQDGSGEPCDVVAPELKTGLEAGSQISAALAAFTGGADDVPLDSAGGQAACPCYVYIPGALTVNLLSGLDKTALKNTAFVVTDPTKIFLDRVSYKRFKAKGLRILTLAGVKVAAVTANPTAPEGYAFESGEFVRAVKAATGGLPVIDVRM